MEAIELKGWIEEGFRGIREELAHRFAAVDQSFAAVDQSFAAVDQSFAAVDQSFAAVDQRFEAQDQRFAAQDKKFAALARELTEFRAEAASRFEEMGNELRARGIQYEEIRHLLAVLNEGESVDLARRVLTLEKRVDRLEQH
jgi:septal ring factor EnvC (AmiA/AmiB activator)